MCMPESLENPGKRQSRSADRVHGPVVRGTIVAKSSPAVGGAAVIAGIGHGLMEPSGSMTDLLKGAPGETLERLVMVTAGWLMRGSSATTGSLP